MPRLLLILLLTTLPALAGAWPLFTAKDFRVRMPATPQHRVEKRATPVGELAFRNWSVLSGPSSFTVTLVEVPALALKLQGPEALLDKAEETVLQKRRGRDPVSRAAEPCGFAGREMRYRAPGEASDGLTWTFLVGRRLFVLDTVVPEGSQANTRFLDSFEVR